MGLRKLFKERSNKSGPEDDGKLKKSMGLEESLQEIQGRYRKLLNHTQAIQYTHDLQGKFLSVDQEITEFLGYDRNSLLNMNIRALLAPEVRHEFETYLAEIKRQGTAKGLMVVQTASGEKRILKYYNTLRTEGVPIPFVQGIAYDVTEQKQTKKALAQLSEQLSIVLESLPIVCYIGKAEEDYGATYITHNVKAITGFEQTDFTSKSSFWANRIHPEDAPKIFADLPQIFKKGYHEHQYRWQVADGSYKWFYDYARLIKSSDGRNYIIGMMQDITERKRAEEALLNAAQQWRTTFDGISDVVCLLDPEGKVLKCNKATTALLGKPFSDILNRPYWEIIYGTAAPMKECPFLRMRENRCRETIILPIGNRWFNIAVDPLFNEAGSLIGAVYIMSDITERRRAAEALRAEKDRLQTVTENAPFGMVIIDKAGTFKYTNPKFRELLGYDLNDAPDGKTWFRKAYPDPTYRHHVISAWINDTDLAGSKPGEKISRTFTVTCKDGTEKIINFLPVKLETDQYLITLVDITVHKKAEEAVRRSEEAATRLSQENAIMAEIGRIISSTLNIEEVYERFAEEVRKLIPFDRIALSTFNHENHSSTMAYVLGVEVGERKQGAVFPLTGSFYEEIISKRSGILIQTEDEKELAKRYSTLLSTFREGLRSFMSAPLISKDQVIGVLHFRSSKPNAYTEEDLRLAERVGTQIAGAIANAQLFNERLRAEGALQRSEEEARRLAQENAIMAEIGRIISSTLDINEIYERFAEEVRILIPFDRIVINIINPENNTAIVAYLSGVDVKDRQIGDFVSLIDSATGECIRTRSSLLFQTESIDEVANRFPGLLPTFKAGLRSMIFIPLISKDQAIGALFLQATKPNAYSERELRLAERVGNQIAGAIANAQLFNERLCAEEKMKALENQLRQSQKMEAIGRLAGGVAHDFNNLLTVVKGYSQISLVMLKEGDPLKENIEEIQKAANRAASLTKQLLVFSRRQILELKVFHLNTILQDLDKMLHRIIGEDIELVYSLSNDLGQVKTDPTQMEQVILNLAINAKDAMPSGGKLIIETSNTTLDESYADSHIGVTPGDYVMLSVSDTGVGMTPEIKERIFEPFFTTKEKGKGTGLGLSIVYGIVQQSGGSIWVYSELGVGTTFKVFLPRIEEDAESLRPTAVPTKSLQGSEAILVVEDEEIVRKLACKVLEKNGYTVLEASNGEEALHIVQKQNGNPIHLVVTDVVMPGMNGHQLVDRLVSLWPQIKALYMSGYTNDAIAHHGVLDPGIAYIQKPFTPDDLTLKVRKVLDGS